MVNNESNILDLEIRDLPITNFNIESPFITDLLSHGHLTIGHLYELQPEGIALTLDVHIDAINHIWEQILDIIQNPDRWIQLEIESPRINLIDEVIPAIEAFFKDIDKLRVYTILVRRFGLKGSNTYTLEDIGLYFDITRERVRQLEAQGLRLLRTGMINGSLNNDNSVKLATEIRIIREYFETDIEPIRTEDEIISWLANRYQTTVTSHHLSFLHLILSSLGWQYISKPSNFGEEILPFWIIKKKIKRNEILNSVKAILKYLRKACIKVSYWDLKIEVNRKRKNKLSDVIIRSAIKVCSDIEQLDDDYFQLSFHQLRGAPDLAYRVLAEAGEPHRAKDIHRHIVNRLAIAGEASPQLYTVSNGMSSDERFVSIGKSEWALVEWEDVIHETIENLMIEFFHKHNQPSGPDEIYTYVKQRRHVSKASISWYLGDSENFSRVGRNLYQLSDWDISKQINSKKRWSKSEIAEMVIEIFNKHNTEKMPLRTLVIDLQKKMNSATEPYMSLKNCPAVITKVVSERPRILEAHVVRDYEIIKTTRKNQVENAIRQVLLDKPDNTMKLTELRDIITKRFNFAPNNVYGYVAEMIDVQKQIVDGSRSALVTLITENNVENVQVQDKWDSEFVYDIAISYAGKERSQARELAKNLRNEGFKIFYDRNQLPDIIGRNLLDELMTIYKDKAKLCVILASNAYNESDFAQHERQCAQARALKDPEYIVLTLLEQVPNIRGFLPTVAYLDWAEYELDGITKLTIDQFHKQAKHQ